VHALATTTADASGHAAAVTTVVANQNDSDSEGGGLAGTALAFGQNLYLLMHQVRRFRTCT
jgi:hypothetical protein